MQPDGPNDEERLEELPEDNETPFAPADPTLDDTAEEPVGERLDDTHPSTDTNIQQEELYEEGVAGAAEVSEPDTPRSPNEDVDHPSDEPGGEDRTL